MGGYDGSIRIDSSIDSKGFNTGIKGMMGAVAKLGAALGVALGVAALVNFGKEAVSTASQTESAWIGLQSIVEGSGKSFGAAKKFLNEYISDGLVPLTNAITAYKNLAARGYSTEQIEQTLNALKDAAAFGKAASLTMGQAVQSATEGLKNENSILVDNSGVTKNVSMMWKDYAESIGSSVNNLTKQQKIQAEVNGILNESRFQVGDAAKLAGTYAGKVAALGTSMYNLKVAVGSAIMPILSAVMPYIKAAVDQLVVFFNMVAGIVAALFGVQLGGAAQAMEDMASGTEAAADAQGDLADQTEATGEAAKGSLATFDEINVLQQQEATGGGGGGGVGGGTGITPPVVTETGSALDAVNEKFETLKDTLLAFFAPLQAPFDRLKEAALTLGGTIWDGLKWVWENILKPLGVWLIQTVAPIFLDILAGVLDTLNEVLLALKPLGIWLWEEFLQPIAEWTGNAIVDVLNWMADALTRVSDWIRNNQELVRTIVIVIGSFAAAWWLVNTAVAVWTAISLIATGVTAGFGAAVAFLTSPIFLVFLAIGAIIAIIILLIKNWDLVKETAGKVWDWIVDKWKDAGTWFTDNVTEPIRLAFKTALDWVKDTWESVWGGVKDFTKNTINTIIDFINSMIRAVAGGINAVIGALNKIQVTIPSWVPEIGGQTWGLNIPLVEAPQIPRLAKGAVIPPNAEFLALLGDQRAGRNIEAPEALLRQIVQEEVGRVQAEIRIEFGGTLGALVRELKPHIDRETVRIGRSLVSGGAA